MSKFLTSQWMSDLTEALNAHEGFTQAIASTDLVLQFEVTDAPDGTESVYHITVGEGAASVTPGASESPDATIANDYETAAAISKGEMQTQMAFMTGKLKVSGNMAKLMMNQAMLGAFADAASAMDVEY